MKSLAAVLLYLVITSAIAFYDRVAILEAMRTTRTYYSRRQRLSDMALLVLALVIFLLAWPVRLVDLAVRRLTKKRVD